MIKAGLWIPRGQLAPKIHQPCYRRPCTGKLMQMLYLVEPTEENTRIL
jgi:hypothetical protein